jgi:RNA polymerase sigma-70 factor (ECF subfamily)
MSAEDLAWLSHFVRALTPSGSEIPEYLRLRFEPWLASFLQSAMNHTSIRGVMRMYKERRAAASGEEIVQEWILSITESRTEAVECTDEARPGNAAVHCEWEKLLVENAPLAFRVARGVLRNDADAEDVAQEALLRAYRRFGGLRERTRFRAWLVRISFRLALDRLRSVKRREQREAQWVYENLRLASAEEVGSEFQSRLESALDELPEKQRLVLLLAAIEGHTQEEVSVLLGVPLGTVKSRLFFAKKALAEKLRCFVNPIESP